MLEFGFKFIKCYLLLVAPRPWYVFCQFSERLGPLAVVTDEMPIVVGKLKEGL